MAELAASGEARVAQSSELDERTAHFFQKNLQVRRKLNAETKKSQDKRFKLREDFGTDAHLFDKWRGEQSDGLNLTNMTVPPRTISSDTLLATRTEAIALSENTIASANTSEAEKGEE